MRSDGGHRRCRGGRFFRAALVAAAVLALWVPSSGEAALRWSAPVLIDHAPPTANTVFNNSISVSSVACASTRLCVAFGGQEVTTTTRPDRLGAWSAPAPVFRTGVGRVASCPSVSLCVAFSDEGEIAVSTRPASGAWRLTRHSTQTQPLVAGLSCPSVSLCVAVDLGGDVITSRDPTGGPAAWTVTNVEPRNSDPSGFGLSAVSCPSVRLCVAADPEGHVLTSTNPTGGASSWSSGQVLPDVLVQGLPNGLFTVSCPSTSRCVAANGHGYTASSSRPSAGASSWRVIRVARASGIGELSCVSSLCVAGSDKGVLWARNPTAPNPRWHLTDLTFEFVRGVGSIACPSVSLCVGGDAYNVVASVRPTGPVSAWRERQFPIPHSLQGVSCPTSKLCVAGDDQGDIVTSSNPAAKRSVWKAFNVPVTNTPGVVSSLGPVSCASTSLCFAGGTFTLISRHPTGGARAWRPVHLPGFSAPSCPSASLCVGASAGGVIVSTNPTDGRQAWRSYAVDTATYSCPAFPGATDTCHAAVIAVSCPTISFCLAVDNLGNTITSTRPAAGASSWTLHAQVGLINQPQPRELPPTLALSCPSARLCVAVNSSGDVETSTNPTGGASDWTHTHLVAPVGLNDFVCNGASSCVAGLTGVSCKAASFCVAVDAGGNAFTSNNPTGGAAAWKRSNINRNILLTGVSCATRLFCVAVDGYGYAVIGRRG